MAYHGSGENPNEGPLVHRCKQQRKYSEGVTEEQFVVT